jgi:hypothetical protein
LVADVSSYRLMCRVLMVRIREVVHIMKCDPLIHTEAISVGIQTCILVIVELIRDPGVRNPESEDSLCFVADMEMLRADAWLS